METAFPVGSEGVHQGRESGQGTVDERVVYLTQRLCVLEVVVAHSVATLSSALRVLQGERLDAEPSNPMSASEDHSAARARDKDADMDARLRRVEEDLGNLRCKMAKDLSNFRDKTSSDSSDSDPTQTAIAAVVVPALVTATDKWSKALTSTVEPVAAGMTTLAQQMERLIDEVQKIGMDGVRLAGRVRQLEAMARLAAPALSARFLNQKV